MPIICLHIIIAGDYTLAICYDKDSKLIQYIELSSHWKTLKYFRKEVFSPTTDIEKEAYERFTEDYNDRELTFLSPDKYNEAISSCSEKRKEL